MQLTCYKCGAKRASKEKVGFREECLQCGEDLHCCKNCRFYDPRAYNECNEPSAEVVREKTRANFCDFFEPSGAAGGVSQKDALKAAADALFKKK